MTARTAGAAAALVCALLVAGCLDEPRGRQLASFRAMGYEGEVSEPRVENGTLRMSLVVRTIDGDGTSPRVGDAVLHIADGRTYRLDRAVERRTPHPGGTSDGGAPEPLELFAKGYDRMDDGRWTTLDVHVLTPEEGARVISVDVRHLTPS